jgi:hypothetical protein
MLSPDKGYQISMTMQELEENHEEFQFKGRGLGRDSNWLQVCCFSARAVSYVSKSLYKTSRQKTD